jgi:hypothetical protein
LIVKDHSLSNRSKHRKHPACLSKVKSGLNREPQNQKGPSPPFFLPKLICYLHSKLVNNNQGTFDKRSHIGNKVLIIVIVLPIFGVLTCWELNYFQPLKRESILEISFVPIPNEKRSIIFLSYQAYMIAVRSLSPAGSLILTVTNTYAVDTVESFLASML